MKFKQFNKIVPFLLMMASIAVFGQKTEKKYNEEFSTNEDVAIHIDASNAEIEVTTWNKKEVGVEAIITIEGLEKERAKEYIEKWNFEAMGNKSLVRIKANGANNFNSRNNTVFFYNTPSNDFNSPGFMTRSDCPPVIPRVYFSDGDFHFDSDWISDNVEKITGEIMEFDFDKYAEDGDRYFFRWKDGANDITIKSRKEFEKFKKSKEYKKLKKELEKMKSSRKERYKDMKKREEKIRKRLKKEPGTFFYGGNTNHLLPWAQDMEAAKKVKVTKKIILRVPKKATFDLNTRHCKIKLPKTKANGKVSYGALDADALRESKLNIYYTPVHIKSIDASNIYLNNVTDADIASVTQTVLNAKASDVIIRNIQKNVNVSMNFGQLDVGNITKDFQKLKIYLNYTNAVINLDALQSDIVYNTSYNPSYGNHKTAMKYTLGKEGNRKLNGNFTIHTPDKMLQVKGKYAQLTMR